MNDEYVMVTIQGERMLIPVSRKELAKNLMQGAENSKKSNLRPGQILDTSGKGLDISEDVLQTLYTVWAAWEKNHKTYFPLGN